MLGLRTVDNDRKSYNNFQWHPVGGTAIAPDWDGGKAECGGGLHFLPWGEGDGRLLNWSPVAIWQVVDDQDAPDTILFDRKAKAHKLTVVFEGNQKDATDYILSHGAVGKAVVGATVVVGNNQVAVVGDYGNATAGDNGIAISGYNGTATAGIGGNAIVGDYGNATAGYNGTATAGYNGTATAGIGGNAIVGYNGAATAGYNGTATAGNYGTATAGMYGTLIIKHCDDRYRTVVGYVGEDGILPNVAYKLDKKGKFVKV